MSPRPPRRGRPPAGGRRPGARRAGAGDGAASTLGRPGAVPVEGRQAVRELLRAGRRTVHEVLVSAPDDAGPVAEIVDLAARAGVPVRRVPRGTIEHLAGTDAPQGVLAWAEPLPEHDLDDLLRSREGAPAPFLVVLDGVTDPHNLGAVMRSALCAGATGVVVGRHRSAPLGAVATKAAAGAVEWLPVAEVGGIPAALTSLVRAGVWTVALDADARAPLWELDLGDQPLALVLGAEGRGLSPLARRRCDVAVSVPLHGPLGSLNVSAAAAVACFEVARRRR